MTCSHLASLKAILRARFLGSLHLIGLGVEIDLIEDKSGLDLFIARVELCDEVVHKILVIWVGDGEGDLRLLELVASSTHSGCGDMEEARW